MNQGFSSPTPAAPKEPLTPAMGAESRPPRRASTLGLVLALTLLSVVGTACKRGDDRGGGHPIKGKASDPAVTFAGRWDETNAFVYHLESITGTQVPRRNSDVVVQQDTVLAKDLRLAAHSLGQDGSRTLRLEVQATRVETTSDQRLTGAFDTENEMLSTEDNAIASRLRRVKGAQLAFRLSPANRVTRVDGMKDFNDRTSGGRNVRGAAGAVIDRFFNQQFYRDLIEMSFLPTNEVRVGESWTLKLKSGAGLYNSTPVDMTYTFRGWQFHEGTNCARFDFVGSTKGASGGGRLGGSSETAEIEGTIWFSPEMGVPIELLANQSVTRQTVSTRIVRPANAPSSGASTNGQAAVVVTDTDDGAEPPATAPAPGSGASTSNTPPAGTVVTSSRTTTTKQHFTLTLVEIVPTDPAVEAAAPAPAMGGPNSTSTSTDSRPNRTRRGARMPGLTNAPTTVKPVAMPLTTPVTDPVPAAPATTNAPAGTPPGTP